MSLGQLLGGAGVVGQAWRTEEDAQRRSRQLQLETEELNRLNRLRQEMLQAPDVQSAPMLQFGEQFPVLPVQPPTTATAAPPLTVPPPVVPTRVAPPAATPAPVSEPTLDPRVRARAEEMLRFNEMRIAQLEQGLKNPNITASQRNTLQQQLDQFRGRAEANRRVLHLSVFPSAPAAATTTAPTTAPSASQSLVNAVIQVESGGDPNAVSPKGARGLMQLMPATAKNPGFGIPPAKDNSNAENLRVGTAYLNAMLRKYDGNLDHALIAYNWGPGNTDKWISKGADPAKLPEETRNYVPKVKAALGQAPTQVAAAPTAAQPAQPIRLAQAPTGIATDVTAPTTGPSAYYLSNPQAIGGDMQRAMRQREELARLAGMYQRSGMGMQFMEARAQLMALDENMFYLQGMQGVQEFSLANDPRRLSAVWSHFAGVPVGVQPRSDGKFDIIVNGERTRQGLSAAEITNQARLSFDSAFRQQQATAGAKAKEEAFKAQLRAQEENSKQLAMMVREIAVEQTRGNNQQALEWAKANYGWDIKPTGAGDGTVIIRPPGASPYLFNPSGRTIEIDGVKIESNAAYPIEGLPSYGGRKP